MTEQGMPTTPGWYPNPGTEGGERFWFGTRWSEQVRTPGQPAPTQQGSVWSEPFERPTAPPPPKQSHVGRTIGIVAGVLVVLLVVLAVTLGGGGKKAKTSASATTVVPVALAPARAVAAVPTTKTAPRPATVSVVPVASTAAAAGVPAPAPAEAPAAAAATTTTVFVPPLTAPVTTVAPTTTAPNMEAPTTAVPPSTLPPIITITISGTGSATITVGDGPQVHDETNQPLPYTVAITDGPLSASAIAQTSSSSPEASISCSLTEPGFAPVSAQSQGPFAVVSCGTRPDQ